MLDRGDHPSRPVPGGGLILDAPGADQRGVAGPAAGPDEEVLDGPLQHGVGREADGVRHAPALQGLVERRDGEGRIDLLEFDRVSITSEWAKCLVGGRAATQQRQREEKIGPYRKSQLRSFGKVPAQGGRR